MVRRTEQSLRAVAVGLAALAAAALAAAPGRALASPAAPVAHAACITRLPVIITVPSRFAAAYGRVLPVTVTSRGPQIRKLRVALYTFEGDPLGVGKRSLLSGSGVVHVKLRFALQPGAYTLYAEGEPNASAACGPKHAAKVLHLQDCITRLPVTFPHPPGGYASDYEGYLSFTLAAHGSLIRHLNVSLSSFAGEPFGSTRLSDLFGTVTVNIPLSRALQRGNYTITVEGTVAAQPRSCGPKSAEQTLAFA